ncbi:hypothetical protein K437DRAFT_273489 [Tilletiaria anomala UBC 951]|uniref:Uncharacterized protein n=1 Tax=Tilletiaria anomala (strain ATCC 24038 / CBS 436.72 / UBC 951) TaxID=1037660 RepID=A0A066WAR8_TILAU|nr:uncharacterized protein K437DRAFT_273489 [Tilletiaria anomala UBC 951]KDN48184.1 hypothetical protein K437DRAFT_273489 [Tilletiaria anomala UBC 951]
MTESVGSSSNMHLDQRHAHMGARRTGRAASSTWRRSLLAAGLCFSLASTTFASREMLQNLPLPGDALRLVQPSWEYAPRGPQKLRYHHRYSQNTLASRIASGSGHDPQEMSEGKKGIADSGLSWEQVAALAPEEPFPMGKSENRIINYGMLIQHRLAHPQERDRSHQAPQQRREGAVGSGATDAPSGQEPQTEENASARSRVSTNNSPPRDSRRNVDAADANAAADLEASAPNRALGRNARRAQEAMAQRLQTT